MSAPPVPPVPAETVPLPGQTPARQAVRAPARRPADRTGAPGRDDLLRQDDYGRALLGSLMRAQLGATVSVLGPAILLLALYPLLAVLVPSLARDQVAGIPLTLLVLGGGIYPPLVVLGFWYVRRAERVERRFGELLDDR
ncbi:MAG: hypothetical protein M0007_15820 [Actinomycetota bacterium]|jgi:hypothetical protein|nr:hypothetical protein [Actinomycetota bacterium]